MEDESKCIEDAVSAILKEGYRTEDIYKNNDKETLVGTNKMGDLIA